MNDNATRNIQESLVIWGRVQADGCVAASRLRIKLVVKMVVH